MKVRYGIMAGMLLAALGGASATLIATKYLASQPPTMVTAAARGPVVTTPAPRPTKPDRHTLDVAFNDQPVTAVPPQSVPAVPQPPVIVAAALDPPIVPAVPTVSPSLPAPAMPNPVPVLPVPDARQPIFPQIVPAEVIAPRSASPTQGTGAEVDKLTAALKHLREQKEAMVREEQDRVKAHVQAMAKLAEREANLSAELKKQIEQLNKKVSDLGINPGSGKSARPLPQAVPNPVPPAASSVAASYYFPTRLGATLVYQLADKEMTYVVTSVEDATAGKVVRFACQIDDQVAYKRTMLVTESGLERLESPDDTSVPPTTLLVLPPTPGRKWGHRVPDKPGTIGFEAVCQVISNGVVEVPAGKFTAVRVDTNGVLSSGAKLRLSSWYAAGVGEVKREENGTLKYELKSFTDGE